MDSKTYSDFNEEQLYLLEFFIDHIDLNIDTTKRIGKLPISVRLKFIDFPIFEINQEEFIHTKQKVEATTKTKEDKLKSGSVDFNMGKLCLFPKKPNDLVQAMRSQPLKVGIFTMTDKNECDQYKEEPAICETNVLLSGCLCDQVNMAINDKNHLPKPYILKNTYNLVDDQGNPSGTILLLLRLTCYGKSVVTQFALQDKFFLFKNSQSPNEFQCIKISSELKMDRAEICESISQQKVEDRLLKPQNVIGLVSICQELAKRDGGPLEINFPPPETVQRKEVKELFRKNSEIIDEEDPFFICPEDGNYLKTLSKIQSCGGIGCKGGLCVGTSLLNPLPRNYHGASPRTSCYTGSCCTGEVKDCCNLFRLRGGGCCEDNTPGDFIVHVL